MDVNCFFMMMMINIDRCSITLFQAIGMEPTEEMTLELFQMWTVKALQDYVGRRGWKKTGSKETLAARAFTAWEIRAPILPSAEENAQMLSHEYSSLLLFNGHQLIDPITIPDHMWITERYVDVMDWPNISFEGNYLPYIILYNV